MSYDTMRLNLAVSDIDNYWSVRFEKFVRVIYSYY